MRFLPSASLILACLAAPAAHAETAAPFDSAQAVARARELREAYSLHDLDKLWRSFDEKMRTAMGDREKFGTLFDGITAQLGKPTNCPAEIVTRNAGLFTVSSPCTFEKTGQPLNMVFVFKEDGQVGGFWVKPDAKPYATTHLDDSTKTALRLPFHGTWTVIWGGRTMEQNYHVISRDQRFAYDIVKTKGGATHEGAGKVNTDYYCWLQPIIAPAAGTVTTAIDGVPDNAPAEMNPSKPPGNHVVLDHGNGEYSLFAHFHRGSVRVKPGQVVAAGDTLGLCGNSGNSSEPHLHYHLQNGPAFGNADGLPAFFVDYFADDKPVARGEPVHGQIIRRNE